MKVQVILVLTVGLMVGADKKEDKVKEELKKFQGEWVMDSVGVNGKVVNLPDRAGKPKWTVKGNTFTVKTQDFTIEWTFTLDPTKNPKQIDRTTKPSQWKEVKTKGIYEFDGDKLKMCYNMSGEERPKEFSPKGGTEKNPVILIVYKRAKKDK
jgi:uncharacterized protein (TIGR03067 family)